MNLNCPVCTKPFSLEEALDLSWIDPDRCFGCPHCKTYFDKHPKTGMIGGEIGLPFILGILGVNFGVNGTGPTAIRVVGLMLVAAGVALLVYNRRVFKRNVAALGTLALKQG